MVVWGQENRKVNVAVKMESNALTEGKKRDIMKKLGPKNCFLNVKEWEAKILSRVDNGVCDIRKSLMS